MLSYTRILFVISLIVILSGFCVSSETGKKKVENPVFSLPEGFYASPKTVGITCATEEAEIYYTLDGSPPSESSLRYSAPIEVAELFQTIMAIGIKIGYEDSDISSATYEIMPKAKTPEFSLEPGYYKSEQVVELSCATANSFVFYTTDGTEPTVQSPRYKGFAIDIIAPEITIKAVCVASGFNNSDIASGIYGVLPAADPPVFSPAAGAYYNGQNVEISTPIEGATIYYTLDGTTPNESSDVYSSPINITAPRTEITAFIVDDNFANSPKASAAYYILDFKDLLNWDGSTVSLSDFAPNYLLLEFSGLWCPWCAFQAAYMKSAKESLAGDPHYITNFESVVVISESLSGGGDITWDMLQLWAHEPTVEDPYPADWQKIAEGDLPYILADDASGVVDGYRIAYYTPDGGFGFPFNVFLKYNDITGQYEYLDDWCGAFQTKEEFVAYIASMIP
jgi:hypothetical protein